MMEALVSSRRFTAFFLRSPFQMVSNGAPCNCTTILFGTEGNDPSLGLVSFFFTSGLTIIIPCDNYAAGIICVSYLVL